MPAATQSSPAYCTPPTGFLAAPNKPYLSISRLHVSRPQMLVTNSSPTPTLAAKKAKPVTNVPPIMPPSQDHQGRRNENILGICLRLSRKSSTMTSSTAVADKNEIKAAWTADVSSADSKLFIGGCIANTAPPLTPASCHGSRFPSKAFSPFLITTMQTPAIISVSAARRRQVNGQTCAQNHPKLSINIPMPICPSIGISAVCTLPSLGKMTILTVSPYSPQTPPSQAHQGRLPARSPSKPSVPFCNSVARARKTVPTVNDTSEAASGETTDSLSLEFAAVCTGVSAPSMNISSK